MFHPLPPALHFGAASINSTSPAGTGLTFPTVDIPKNQLSNDQLDKMPLPMTTATVFKMAVSDPKSTTSSKSTVLKGNFEQSNAKTTVKPPPYENPPVYSENDGAELPPYSKEPIKTTQNNVSPPTKSPLPAKKPLSEQLQSMSEPERNKLIAKLINIVSHQQAQLSDQQAQLEDFIGEQQYHLNSAAHAPAQAPIPNAPPNPLNNPFLKPNAKAAAASAAEKTDKAWYRYVLDLFPAKYMKNLPMNFLESFVQNAGATMGSRGADLFHEKVVYPTFVKKLPQVKKSMAKESFQEAGMLAPQIILRAISDSTSHGVINWLLR